MSESRQSFLGTSQLGATAPGCSGERSSTRSFALESQASSFANWLRLAAGLALSTLREIFDESAYARFLGKNNLRSCPGAYGLFLREQESIKARHPKCC
jgi:hypothetical protein